MEMDAASLGLMNPNCRMQKTFPCGKGTMMPNFCLRGLLNALLSLELKAQLEPPQSYKYNLFPVAKCNLTSAGLSSLVQPHHSNTSSQLPPRSMRNHYGSGITKLEDALHLFDEMIRKNPLPSLVYFTCLTFPLSR